MKKIFALSTAMFLAGAVTASANDLSFVGNSEYQFEAETFELNAGAEYATGVWTFTGLVNSEKVSDDDFEFTGLTLGATVEANENVDVYGILETDGDLNYEETTVGVAFRF